ncbi:TRAP transporter large permease subunit [uncultured Sulfitobacter sp.]|uniref:TRAP transporter large permease n=1 Tax=uncultured Sulfitobacter sp. TaxID=191468 RepID=UPI002596FC2A|nr:TRAP transporter large permease subunit [uncultured Sulfitobacter sp.]
MSEHMLPITMAAVTLIGIMAGYRVAFVLAGSAALFILVTDTPVSFFKLILSRIYTNVLSNWLLVAIPMFIFMGFVLEKSGVAERSLKGAQRALGGTPAGMGISVLVVGVMLAASSGIVGASVVLLTLLALPRLQEVGFDKATSAGLIASSGTLAILIPPSIMLIILGDQLEVPIGDMFAAAIPPGLMLVAFYGTYLVIKTRKLRMKEAPTKTPIWRTLIDVGPLILLVLCVLGSIVGGVATPTEAAGLGAFGAIAIAAAYGFFSVPAIMQSARETVSATSMIFMVLIGATCFSAIFRKVGGDEAIFAVVSIFGDGPWTILFVVLGMIFLLGFVLDWLEITLILMPIFGPLVAGLDFGNGLTPSQTTLWFAILVALNLQTSFLTPPFGFSLFYLRGAAKNQLSTNEIYRGVLPFIALQLLALGLLIAFPVIIVGFV